MSKTKLSSISKFKIGLIQIGLSKNPDDNLKKAITWIERAAKKGANVICLPELFRSQYFCQKEDIENYNLAETVPGPQLTRFLKYASNSVL